MSNRTVLIVLGVAVALLAFILLFERETMTTSELESRRDRVFVDFRRERVEGLEIRGTDGVEIALVKRGGAGDEADEWRIVTPRELAADQSAVRGVLSAIDFLLKDRTVEGEEVAAQPAYGLTEPRIVASFTMRGRATAFRVGAEAQAGDKVYLALDDRPGEFYAVEQEFFESLDLGLDGLRDKHLVHEPLGEATALRVERPSATLDLSRDADAPWQIARGGGRVLAAADQVGELLAAIGGLEAERFVADDVDEEGLAAHGLARPTHTVTIRSAGDEPPLRLLLGAPCPTEHRVHATVSGTGTVVCVADELVALLDRPLERLCELRAAVFRADDVGKVTLGAGERRLVLERDDEERRWIMVGEHAPAVEQQAVSDLLEQLAESRASALDTRDEALAGLPAPAATVALELDAGQEPIELHLFPGERDDHLRLRRGDERAVLSLAGDLLTRVVPDPLLFRERKIDNGDHRDVVSLAIAGPSAQRLERDGDEWKLVAPVQLAADGGSVRELARLLAEVEVVRWAASTATAAHGLSRPWAVVTAHFATEETTAGGQDRTGERAVELEIGAEADPGRRFGRIRGADGAVFVVGTDYVDALSRPLVARDLLQLDSAAIVKLELTGPGGAIAARRDRDQWTAADGAVDGADLARIVADLGATKAIRADRFGGPGAAADVRDAIEIKAWTAEQDAQGSPAVLTIGPATDDAAERGHLAWRNGIDVTFVIPTRIAEDLSRLWPPPG